MNIEGDSAEQMELLEASARNSSIHSIPRSLYRVSERVIQRYLAESFGENYMIREEDQNQDED